MASRQNIYDAMVAHAKGRIEKHVTNVQIYMEKAVGIGEHGDILETIEKELKVIAEYHDQLEVLEKYIKRD